MQDKISEENRRKEKEGTLPCVADLPGDKQNLIPINPPAPTQDKEKKQTARRLDMSKFKTPAARKSTLSQTVPPAAEAATSITTGSTQPLLYHIQIKHVKDGNCPAHIALNLSNTPPKWTQIGQRKIRMET